MSALQNAVVVVLLDVVYFRRIYIVKYNRFVFSSTFSMCKAFVVFMSSTLAVVNDSRMNVTVYSDFLVELENDYTYKRIVVVVQYVRLLMLKNERS